MKAKRFKKKALAASVLGLTLLSVGCGKSEPANNNPAPAPAPAPMPVPGPVLPPPGTGCVPLTQPVPFTYNGAAVTYNPLLDSPAIIKMGQIPGMQAFGQAFIGGGMTNGSIQRQHVDGSIINMTMQLPGASQQNPQTQQVIGNGAGYIQLSQVVQQDVFNKAMSGQIPGLQGQNPQSLCASGIAIDGGTYRNGNSLFFNGKVYIYLNGTTHGYVEEF